MAEPVIIPLESPQVAELAPLLRDAYNAGLPVFGEVRRDDRGVYLICAVLDKEAGRKVQRLIAGALRATTKQEQTAEECRTASS